MPNNHALLSASASHRWLNCPPSARLCADKEDTASEYALQGTEAHSLCEHKLKLLLGLETQDPTANLYFLFRLRRCRKPSMLQKRKSHLY